MIRKMSKDSSRANSDAESLTRGLIICSPQLGIDTKHRKNEWAVILAGGDGTRLKYLS
jgi:hypothetical protein